MSGAPKLAILTIGEEILFGKIHDTNASYISDWALTKGFSVEQRLTLPDDEKLIAEELKHLSRRVDFIVVTGGLGPTIDDRTRDALALYLNKPLKEHAGARKVLEKFINERTRSKKLGPSSLRQVQIPKGTKVIPNKRGTAPGILAEKKDKHGSTIVACMPGVPHEMKGMLIKLDSKLEKLFPKLRQPVCEEIFITDIGESTLQENYSALLHDKRCVINITVSDASYICLRVVGAASRVKKLKAKIHKRLERYIMPHGSVAASLIDVLTQKGEEITAAESCTCGNVVSSLGAISGASAVLKGSVVSYHQDTKQQFAQVDPLLIKEHGEVSQEVAEAMALGIAKQQACALAVATTGVAGPGGGSVDKPVGTVWIAIAYHGRVRSRKLQLAGSRERIQARAASEVLMMAFQAVSKRGGRKVQNF